jgi:Cys-tRNA synthase (O-phospho-L-seryl-tRNA:Cys-tRNA synthase)
MKPTVVWPIAAVVALGIVVLGIATVEAQRAEGDRAAFVPAPHAGRFVVAHALAERIVILDTATGQLYVAGEKDMKKFSEMPKVGDGHPTIDASEWRRVKDGLKKKFGKKDNEKKDDPN